MATLALKPVFPIRSSPSGSKRDHPKPESAREALHAKPWRTMAVTGAAITLTFFSVLAPIIDDPTGRLLALDTTPTITAAAIGDAWTAGAFEFTPTTLGPAISAEMLLLAEEDDEAVVTMPELEVRAMPPAEDDEATPPG